MNGISGGKVGWVGYADPCTDNYLLCEHSDVGGGIYSGYQLLDWLAIEGGYDNFSGPSADYFAIGDSTQLVHYESEIQGFELGLKADLALTENLILFGKGGAFFWETEKKANEPFFGSIDERDNGQSLMLGTGIDYRLGEHWSVRLEYQFFDNVGDINTGGTDVHFVGLGIDYRFSWSEETTVTGLIPLAVVSEPEAIEAKNETKVVSPLTVVVRFVTNSDELSIDFQESLHAVIERLQDHPQSKVIISGYTDNVGRAEDNQMLSEKRAEMVASVIMMQTGIELNRITVKGFGEMEPVSSNDTKEGRAENRRVVIISPKVMINTRSEVLGK
ncbi:OmpA family protein [Shewanella sp. VB17]|uniref:OmpA family protein n=1 Tax=Shewanella sp. VB17 TaxID=2739432 RepID=UPI001565974C|nr:OmpA family protein [Shewanella sp. VB17]NRD74746.1 OmpA family protein [Shewanella sp. VB17]